MTTPIRKTIVAVATAAAFADSAQAESVSRIPDSQTVRNVVLVHGAFADGSGWRARRAEAYSWATPTAVLSLPRPASTRTW
jgi:hypothetical protein